MAKNPFAEDPQRLEKKIEPKSLIETSGYIISAAILFAVIIVMTTDIRGITFQSVASLSLQMFVLMFCSYGMYVSMYSNGIISAEKLTSYIEITDRYNKIREEIVSGGNDKRLYDFCRDCIESERASRIEDVLAGSGISAERYEKLRFLSRKDLIKAELTSGQIRAVRSASRIRPIKLTPEMLCKAGKAPIKRGVMHMQPAVRRKYDFIKKFITTAVTSCAMGFIAFEVFADPSWSTVCSVAFKVLMVALTGYSGYKRGYDNIAVDTVLYTQDQIDMLERFKSYLSSERRKTGENEAKTSP